MEDAINIPMSVSLSWSGLPFQSRKVFTNFASNDARTVFGPAQRMYKFCYGFIFPWLVLFPGGSKGFLIKYKMNKPTPVRQGETKLRKEKEASLYRIHSMRCGCPPSIGCTGYGMGALALWGALGEVWVPSLYGVHRMRCECPRSMGCTGWGVGALALWVHWVRCGCPSCGQMCLRGCITAPGLLLHGHCPDVCPVGKFVAQQMWVRSPLWRNNLHHDA